MAQQNSYSISAEQMGTQVNVRKIDLLKPENMGRI